MLRLLEENYHSAVDMEFAVQILEPFAQPPKVQVILLQCRPQSMLKETPAGKIPEHLESEDIVFSTRFMVPSGFVANIRHVLFVPPAAYYALSTERGA